MSIFRYRRYLSVIQAAAQYLTPSQAAALYQPLDADLTAVAASNLAAPWTIYTPIVTAGTGTFTTVSATGRYVVIGKSTEITIVVTITTNGTAGAYFAVTLPNTAGPASYILPARESAATGYMGAGYIAPGANNALVTKYDATYLGGSGYVIILTGCYESA